MLDPTATPPADDPKPSEAPAPDAGVSVSGGDAIAEQEAERSRLFKEMAEKESEEPTKQKADDPPPDDQDDEDNPPAKADAKPADKTEDPPKKAEDDDKTPDPKAKAGESDAAPAKPAPPAPPTDDELLATVPENQRGAFKKLLAQRDSRIQSLEQRLTEAGRAKAALLRRVAAGTAPHDPASSAEAKAAKAEWDKYEEQYPIQAAGIRAFAKASGIDSADTRKLLAFVAEDHAVARAEEINEYVQAAHAAWVDVVNSDDFKGWVKTQSQKVQKWAFSDDPEEAVLLLDRYKAQRPAEYAAARPAAPAKPASETPPPGKPPAPDDPEAARIAARRKHQQEGGKSPDERSRGAPDQDNDSTSRSSLFKAFAKKADRELAGG